MMVVGAIGFVAWRPQHLFEILSRCGYLTLFVTSGRRHSLSGICVPGLPMAPGKRDRLESETTRQTP